MGYRCYINWWVIDNECYIDRWAFNDECYIDWWVIGDECYIDWWAFDDECYIDRWVIVDGWYIDWSGRIFRNLSKTDKLPKKLENDVFLWIDLVVESIET
jgi:hypothetical protein